MKLTKNKLKQIINEELQRLLIEDKAFVRWGQGGNSSVVLIHSDPPQGDETGQEDLERGRQRFERTEQVVAMGSNLYNDLKDFYGRQGYRFEIREGGVEKVIPPKTGTEENFIFVAQLSQEDQQMYPKEVNFKGGR